MLLHASAFSWRAPFLENCWQVPRWPRGKLRGHVMMGTTAFGSIRYGTLQACHWLDTHDVRRSQDSTCELPVRGAHGVVTL